MKRLFPLLVFLISLSACEENNPQDSMITLNQTSVEVDFNSTFQLEAKFNRDGYIPGDFNWSSEKTRIATVSQSGLITGKKVGETKVFVKTKDGIFSSEALIKVLPTNFLYTEPVFGWRGNKTFIKNNEKRSVREENATQLIFFGGNPNEQFLIYTFEKEIMISAVIRLAINQVVSSNLIDFIEQRYDPITERNNTFFFQNPEVVIGVQVQSGGVAIAYVKNTSTSSGRINQIEFIKQELEKIKGA